MNWQTQNASWETNIEQWYVLLYLCVIPDFKSLKSNTENAVTIVRTEGRVKLGSH